MPEHIEVLWDGTANRPWGKFLFAPEEKSVAAANRPYRTFRDLSKAERDQIVDDIQVFHRSPELVQAEHHISEYTVAYLLKNKGQA